MALCAQDTARAAMAGAIATLATRARIVRLSGFVQQTVPHMESVGTGIAIAILASAVMPARWRRYAQGIARVTADASMQSAFAPLVGRAMHVTSTFRA